MVGVFDLCHKQIVYLFVRQWNKRGVDNKSIALILVPMKALEKAIESVGSAAALAKALKVVPMTVSGWKKRGVPTVRVISIVVAVNGAVRPYDLDPINYPDPDWMPPDLLKNEFTATSNPSPVTKRDTCSGA